LIPEASNKEVSLVNMVVLEKASEEDSAPNEHISQCNQKSGVVEMDDSWADNLSSGEGVLVDKDSEMDAGWQQHPGNKRQAIKRKKELQATRQSLRLKKQGGVPVEELATKKKQLHNLDPSGTSQKNAFAILNDIHDDALIKYAKDLDISLAKDEEGCRQEISATKAEEKLRGNIAEARD
jgi:hypothetical protein